MEIKFQHKDPQPTDIFLRSEIVRYLDNIPLGERNEQDVISISNFIKRAQLYFSKVDIEQYNNHHD